jgi:hypothetical protein
MPERDYRKIWIEQCDATEGIRDRFGLESALGYLVGEKFLTFLRAGDRDPDLAAEMPAFVGRVKEIFEPHELSGHFEALERERSADADGAYPFRDLKDADVSALDVVDEAERVLLIDRAKELLLG